MDGRLVKAVRDNKVDEVEALLNAGASPDACDSNRWPVLVIACMKGFNSIVQHLLQKGAKVNKANPDGDTALMWAAYHGYDSLIVMLLSANADGNLKEVDGRTALHLAALHNHSKVVRILLEKGCDSNIKAKRGETALEVAVRRNNKDAADAIKTFTIKTPSASSLPGNSASSDEWKIMETTTTAPEEVAQPVASVAENIGNEGGLLQSDSVSVLVPEGTVSVPTTFSIATYLDEQVMPQVNEEEVVVSPVVYISTSQSSHKFSKPVQLSLRPEVALKPREHETGWLLELKMSESSTEGKPSEWHTMLQLNTDTEEVETHSSSIRYDPNTQTLYVNDVGYMVWLGKALGNQSMRDVRYALFGQQLQLHNWKIAAHIIHGSISAYNEIAENMKSKSYEELTVPIKDRIGLEGKVRMSIECCEPWQMGLGSAVTYIPTRRIWNSRKDAACYYEFTLQDRERSSDTLQCTVVASFEHCKQVNSDDPTDPVTLIVAHPLTKPRLTEITTGDRTALDTVLVVGDDIAKYAKEVTRNSDKLGGFWLGWSAIPVDVIRDVSHLVTDIGIAHLVAKSLLSDESVEKSFKSIFQSREPIFTIIKLWIDKQEDKATLDKLFRSLQTHDLFLLLQRRLDERMQTQKPQKVGIARFQPAELFRVVNDNGASRYLELGLKIGLTFDQVNMAAEGHTYSGKLLALYMTKRKEVGEYRAVARLMTAVDKTSIMGFVEDALPGVKAALEESRFYSEVEEATAPAASHHSSESKGDDQLVQQQLKQIEQLREESLATNRENAELRQQNENEREELGRQIEALQQQKENEREELLRQNEALQQHNESLQNELLAQIEAQRQQNKALQQQNEFLGKELTNRYGLAESRQQNENEREEIERQIEALQQQNEFREKDSRKKQLQREHAMFKADDTERLVEETDDGEDSCCSSCSLFSDFDE